MTSKILTFYKNANFQKISFKKHIFMVGKKGLIGVVIYYLIRDITLYIIIPYFFSRFFL